MPSCAGSGLSSPICLRMTSISSLPALGPEAKNTAGSPGSTRISRKVKTSTPNSAGREDRKRPPARLSVAPIMLTVFVDALMRWLLAAQIAIVDLARELVDIAVEAWRHHRVLRRLPQWNLEHLIEVDGVELPALLLILRLVRLEARGLRDLLDLGIVGRGVIPALIAGVEVAIEVIWRRQPGDDALGEERQLLLVDRGRHLRVRQLLDVDLDADLFQGFLDQRRHRLGRGGLADVEGEGGGETFRHAGFLEVRPGLLDIELDRLRNGIAAARRLAVGPGRAEQRRAAAEQRGLEHVVIGQRIGDRPAHIDVVEGRDLVVHRYEGHRVILRRGDHLELALGLKRLDIARLQIDHEISVAT